MTRYTIRRRGWWTLLLVPVVLAGACGGGNSTPIDEQSCAQLARTFAKIQTNLDPSKPFDVKSRATQDASRLNARVDDLGGCPDEPSLR